MRCIVLFGRIMVPQHHRTMSVPSLQCVPQLAQAQGSFKVFFKESIRDPFLVTKPTRHCKRPHDGSVVYSILWGAQCVFLVQHMGLQLELHLSSAPSCHKILGFNLSRRKTRNPGELLRCFERLRSAGTLKRRNVPHPFLKRRKELFLFQCGWIKSPICRGVSIHIGGSSVHQHYIPHEIVYKQTEALHELVPTDPQL